MCKKTSFAILLLILLQIMTLSSLVSAESTTLQVDPSDLTVDILETFEVNITIIDVTNLTSWEFRLYYLNGVVNCTNIAEGPFLSDAGGTFHIFNVTNAFNSTHGRILAACTILGEFSSSGSGTLATITFKAIGGGDSALNLDETKLGDEEIPPQEIPHTALDGVVHVTGELHDVAVTDVYVAKTVVLRNYTMFLNVTVDNQGDFTETFNLTVQADATEIVREEMTLTTGESATVTLPWNSTGTAKGNYTLTVYALPVPGETETTDNSFTDGWVIVSMVCDITGPDGWPDGKSDMRDVALVAQNFGKAVPPAPANCDITGRTQTVPDGTVDMRDIAVVARYFGAIDP